MADQEEAESKPAAAKPAAAAKKEEGPVPPDGSPIYQRILAAAGDCLAEGSRLDRGDLIIEARLDRVHDLCRLLRDHTELRFDYLCQVTAIDDPKREPRFEVVWTMLSTRMPHLVHVVVRVGDGQAVPTVSDLWRTANWHEREMWDMFGIPIAGHPDLRRILLPDWWAGFPLRKEYPVEGKNEHELVVEECLRPRV